MKGPEPARVLAYSFDGMGLGHLRRNLTLLSALTERVPGTAVLTVTGSGAMDRFQLPEGVEVLRLPGLVKTTLGTTRPGRLPLPTTEVRKLRADLLTAAVRSFRPDLVLVDFYPLGRDGELADALAAVREVHPHVQLVLGLRDILDAPDTVRREWQDSGQFTAAAELYDRVLIYGDPAVYDATVEYAFPSSLAAKTAFTGYLATARAAPAEPGPLPSEADIVCTMGGGSDAADLARTFVRAVRPLLADGHRALLLTGPFMPAADVALLMAEAPEGLEVRNFVPDAPAYFARSSCVVTMAGYNTTCELLSAGVPTVFVPRSRPRLEQRIRATRIAALTGWHVLMPEDLNAEALQALISVALAQPRTVTTPIAREGANVAAAIMAELLISGTERAVNTVAFHTEQVAL